MYVRACSRAPVHDRFRQGRSQGGGTLGFSPPPPPNLTGALWEDAILQGAEGALQDGAFQDHFGAPKAPSTVS